MLLIVISNCILLLRICLIGIEHLIYVILFMELALGFLTWHMDLKYSSTSNDVNMFELYLTDG